jgi:hypothetical protein
MDVADQKKRHNDRQRQTDVEADYRERNQPVISARAIAVLDGIGR